MGERNRERKPSRREPFRDQKPLILIVSEGKNTEPDYFNGLRNEFKNPRVQIRTEGGKGVPKTVVEEAKKFRDAAINQAKDVKDDNLEYDQVWCVFDRDEFTQLPEAFEMARANNIQVAFSNPNFELWLYLHFADQPGQKSRQLMKKLLRKFVPSYDPDSKHVDISLYISGYTDAVRRAKRLCDRPDDKVKKWERNPYTDVYRLTEIITETVPEPTEEKLAESDE